MFLRATKRFKDGTVHDYWSMVENVRGGNARYLLDEINMKRIAVFPNQWWGTPSKSSAMVKPKASARRGSMSREALRVAVSNPL